MRSRFICSLAFLFLAAQFASAQTVDVSVLIDDPATAGCDVTPMGLAVIGGVDARLTATVDRLAATVINVDLSLCGGATFGPGTSLGGGWPVGNNNGLMGADVVEMSVPRAMVTPGTNSLRIAAAAENTAGADATALGVFATPLMGVPGLGLAGLLVLSLLVLALAWVALKRQRVLLSLMLFGMAFAVWAMNFMVDGLIGDWTSVPPVSTDPTGDATNGETAVDIVAVFAAQEDQGGGPELFLRVDMADLIINNQLPVAQDDNLATDEDNPVSGDLFADNGNGVDSDPDPDPFTVTMVAGTATVGSAVNLPSGAQVTVNADGTFTYDPLTAFNFLSQGQTTTDTFTYTIDDAIAGSDQATATVTITGINDVGTAVDDPGYATGEDTPLSQAAPGVLGNDTDPDTNDTLSAVLDAGPSNALSFTLNGDGSFNYTPALNFNGLDTFTYHFNDGLADSNMATATITVGAVNDPPVAVDDSGDATDEDTPITTQNVLTNDTDADMDMLSVLSADAVSAQGAAITDNGNGTFNYDPTVSASLNALSVGQMTTDTFSYTVTDGLLNDMATVSVDVTGVNDPMTAVDDSGDATDEDTAITTQNVLLNDSDPDAADTLSVQSVDPLSAQGAAITDLGNGTFTYDPTGAAALQALATGAMVTDTFSYTGTDGNGSNDPATVSIDVTGINDAPVIAFPTGGAVFNNVAPINLDPAATLSDVDSPDFDSGDLTVSLALSADPSMCDVSDALTVENQGMGATQIGFDGVNVSYEGTQFGTVTANYLCTDTGGGTFTIDPLLITFDPNASIAAVTALLQALQYNTGSADDQDRQASAMVTDGDGGTSNAALATITVNLNQAPVITSDGGGATAAVNAAENQTAVTTVTATDADIPAQTLTFSISGGADQALFSIGAGSGVLTFLSAPDFENPTDSGMNNVYDVQVTVIDNGTPNQTDVQDIAVTVTDVNDTPVITSDGGGATAAVNAAENQTAVTTVTATDEDLPAQTLTFTISGGADQALFGIGAGSGVLTFNSAPDFENPTDAGMNNVYDVQVTVTDNGTPNQTDVQDIAVTVTDVNDAPVITSDGGGATAAVNAAENQTAVTTVTATDEDLPAQTLTFSISGGADQALFGIGAGSGVLTFLSAPDFENPTDAGMNNVYDVQVTVTDNGAPNLTDVQDVAVTVTDANDPPVITSDGGGATAMVNADENQMAVTTVTAVDADLPAQTLSFTITGGADQAFFGIVAGTGVLTFNSAPDFENPIDAGMNNVYDVQVTVTDNGAPNLSDVQDIAVTVNDVNEAPTAMNESFAVQSNVGIQPAALNGILTNDTDPDMGDSVSLVAGSIGTFATAAGGSITTAADGSFTYTPQAGDVSVADTFAYTVQDTGALTAMATATFNVDSNTIWFVDLDAGTTGDGTLSDPFDSLADLDNGGPDANGSTIFHYTSTMGAQTDALSDDFDLQASQLLIGEGVAGAGTINDFRGFTTHPFSLTLPSIGAALNHSITSSATGGITLSTGNTIRGLDIGNTGAGIGITGSNFGTLTIDDVTINGTGRIFNLDTGTVTDPTGGDFTFGSLASTSNSAIGIDLNAVSGGFTVNGSTSISGGTLGIDIDGSAGSFDFGTTSISGGTDAGIDIATSGTGTFTFDSLSITNDSGSGLVATTGGTLNVAGATNTINSTGGAGVDIDGTSLDVTFSTITTTDSPDHGIDLTGVSGTQFTVTGNTTIDMAIGSNEGINVLNSTLTNLGISTTATVAVNDRRATGISLNNVSNTVTFGDTDIPNPNNAGGDGVRVLSSSGNFTFASIDISATTVTSAQTFVDVDPGIGQRFFPAKNGNGDGIFLDTVSGSFTVNGGLIQDIGDNAVDVFDSSDITIDGVTISDGGDGDAFSTINTSIQVTSSSDVILRDVSISNFGNEVAAGSTIRENAVSFRDVSGQSLMQRCTIDFGSGFVFERFAQLPENIGLEIENRLVDLEMVISGTTFEQLDFQQIQARHMNGDLTLAIDGADPGDGATTFTMSNGAAIDFGQTAADAGGSVGNLMLFDTDFTDVGISLRSGTLNTSNLNVTLENNIVTRTFSDGLRMRGFGGPTASTVTGRIPGNLFDDVGLAISTIPAQNPGAGNGLEMLNELRTDSTILYTGNTIDDVVDNGGSIGLNIANNSLSTMDLVFTGNVVRGITADMIGGDPAQDFSLVTTSSMVGAAATCIALTGNDMTPTSPIGIFGLTHDFLFDIAVDGMGSTVTLEDYGTPMPDVCSGFGLSASAEAFVDANNTTDQACALLDELNFTLTSVDPAPGGANLCTRPATAATISAVGSTTVGTPATLSVVIAPVGANIPVRFTATTGGGGQTAVFPAGHIAYTNGSGVAALPIQSNGIAGGYTISAETIPPTGSPVVYTVTNP